MSSSGRSRDPTRSFTWYVNPRTSKWLMLIQLSFTRTVVNPLGFIDYVGAASLRESQEILKHASEPLIVLDNGTFLLPTFCDLHLHAPQFLYQGTGLHLPLMEWLNEYAFKAEERLDTDPALAERVYTRLTERLIENGTGAVLLFGTIKVDTK